MIGAELRKLEVYYCGISGSEFEGSKWNFCPKIEEINISYNKVGSKGMQSIMQSGIFGEDTLESLYMVEVDIDDEFVAILLPKLI